MDRVNVFDGFATQVDFPRAAVREKLVVAFPDAKALHTERPEDEWWASYAKTIGKAFLQRKSPPVPPPIAALLEKMNTLLIKGVFGGLDRERSIAAHRRNNEKVHSTVPANKLLVFPPRDGWDSFCKLLGIKSPTTDFPRSNTRLVYLILPSGLGRRATLLTTQTSRFLPVWPPTGRGRRWSGPRIRCGCHLAYGGCNGQRPHHNGPWR